MFGFQLHLQDPFFNNIRIVYFGALGTELQEVENNKEETKKRLSNRLKEKHNLKEEEAVWLINSLKFGYRHINGQAFN